LRINGLLVLAGGAGAAYLAYAGGFGVSASLIAGIVGAGLAYGLKMLIRMLIIIAILVCAAVQFGVFQA